jgi:chemotaxis protein CheD
VKNMEKIVGIGGYALSNNRNDTLKTFALASCVALTAYCPVRNAAGMLHIALPAPDKLNDDSIIRLYYYAVTAVPLFINKLCNNYGCSKTHLEIQLFGGADSIRMNDVFQIGKKNIHYVKESLEGLKLLYNASETGGKYSRSLEMDVFTGQIKLTLQLLKI